MEIIMNKHESNKVTMYKSVEAVLSQHEDIVNTMPALSEINGKFRSLLKEIIERDYRHATVKQGSTAAKNSALDSITATTLTFANALYALGRKTENEQLKAECRTSISELEHKREQDLEQYCRRIGELARNNAEELAPYCITKKQIDSFSKATETFRDLVEQKNQKFTESKATREALDEMFKKMGEMLREDMDRLLEMLRDTHPDFYRQYTAARNIRDIGSSHAVKTDDTEDAETIETVTSSAPVMVG